MTDTRHGHLPHLESRLDSLRRWLLSRYNSRCCRDSYFAVPTRDTSTGPTGCWVNDRHALEMSKNVSATEPNWVEYRILTRFLSSYHFLKNVGNYLNSIYTVYNLFLPTCPRRSKHFRGIQILFISTGLVKRIRGSSLLIPIRKIKEKYHFQNTSSI